MLRRLAAALLLAAAASACGSAEAGPSEGTRQLEVDGRERSYLLQPAEGSTRALVVVLHQEGGTPEGVAQETELQELRRHGVALAYPAGIDSSWDAGKCCGLPQQQGVDDVRFLDRVIADAAGATGADRARTALVGYSSGGMLTYRYVCARPGRLAAAVVVSGSLEAPCDGDVSVPHVLALHGKRDGTIGLNRPVFVKALGLSPRPVASTLKVLTERARCAPQPTERRPDVEIRRWDCRGGSLQALLVADKGHGWGGLDASRRTREFLRDRLLDG